ATARTTFQAGAARQYRRLLGAAVRPARAYALHAVHPPGIRGRDPQGRPGGGDSPEAAGCGCAYSRQRAGDGARDRAQTLNSVSRRTLGRPALRRVGKAKRAHHFHPRISMVGTAQERLCPPYQSKTSACGYGSRVSPRRLVVTYSLGNVTASTRLPSGSSTNAA